MTPGENIRALRKSMRLTIQNISDATGLGKSTISDIETNKTNPSTATLKKIATALDVSVSLLLEDDCTITNPTCSQISSNSKANPHIHNTNIQSYNPDFKFSSAIDAIEFILSQPVIGNYGEFDINKMSDTDKINFANDLLDMVKMLSGKYTK